MTRITRSRDQPPHNSSHFVTIGCGEAVLSAFNFSDLGREGGTNTKGRMLQLEYQAATGVVFSVKHHIVTLVRPLPERGNPAFHRLQVDLRVGL